MCSPPFFCPAHPQVLVDFPCYLTNRLFVYVFSIILHRFFILHLRSLFFLKRPAIRRRTSSPLPHFGDRGCVHDRAPPPLSAPCRPSRTMRGPSRRPCDRVPSAHAGTLFVPRSTAIRFMTKRPTTTPPFAREGFRRLRFAFSRRAKSRCGKPSRQSSPCESPKRDDSVSQFPLTPSYLRTADLRTAEFIIF